MKKYPAFTLIEMLVVVGLLAILFSMTIIAINPFSHFEDTRNTQRGSDIRSILNAIYEYTSNDPNDLTSLIGLTNFTGTIATCTSTAPSTSYTEIANSVVVGGPNNDQQNYIDLEVALVDEYLVEIPHDPTSSSNTSDGSFLTGYAMCQSSGGRIQVIALYTEGGPGKEDLYVIR